MSGTAIEVHVDAVQNTINTLNKHVLRFLQSSILQKAGETGETKISPGTNGVH